MIKFPVAVQQRSNEFDKPKPQITETTVMLADQNGYRATLGGIQFEMPVFETALMQQIASALNIAHELGRCEARREMRTALGFDDD